MDEIKTDIHKSRLILFRHVMRMTEERMPKNMLHTQMEGKLPRGRPRIRRIVQVRKVIEIKGSKWEEIQENKTKIIEMAGDFSLMVHP